MDESLPAVLAGAAAEAEARSEGDRMTKATPESSDSLVFECDFDEPPEKVWRALTEPQLLEAWLITRFKAPRATEKTHSTYEVLRAEPHRLLRYRWRDQKNGAA